MKASQLKNLAASFNMAGIQADAKTSNEIRQAARAMVPTPKEIQFGRLRAEILFSIGEALENAAEAKGWDPE